MAAEQLTGIVLGHNAFFGVDHLSTHRGTERAAYFADPARIVSVVRDAREAGANGMMMSTHERAAPLCALFKVDPMLRQDLPIYPLLPYAQKYVTRANEVGMVNAVLEMLSGTTLSQKLKLFAMGGKLLIAKDINAALGALIQIELKHFSGLSVPAVFLHDAFTDLALGFGMPQVFEFYLDEIRRAYGAQGAFATKNLPFLLERFKQWGLPPPLVMTHVNMAGYHMNPDREACERAAAEYECRILVMGSLASGYLRPDEAYAYLSTISNIDGVVVGVSRPEHVTETFGAIRRHLPQLRMRQTA